MPSTAFILLAIVFVLVLAVLVLNYILENVDSFLSQIERFDLTSFFLATLVCGVLGVVLWNVFGVIGVFLALIWFVQWVSGIGSSSSSSRDFWANDQSSLSDDSLSFRRSARSPFGDGLHEPSFNIDGTPMMGAFDMNGNPYGVTDMSSSSSDMFSSSSSSSDMFSSSSSSHSFD